MLRLRTNFYQLIAFLSILCLAVPLAAMGDFWVKKPYQNWSAEETRRVLEESLGPRRLHLVPFRRPRPVVEATTPRWKPTPA